MGTVKGDVLGAGPRLTSLVGQGGQFSPDLSSPSALHGCARPRPAGGWGAGRQRVDEHEAVQPLAACEAQPHVCPQPRGVQAQQQLLGNWPGDAVDVEGVDGTDKVWNGRDAQPLSDMSATTAQPNSCVTNGRSGVGESSWSAASESVCLMASTHCINVRPCNRVRRLYVWYAARRRLFQLINSRWSLASRSPRAPTSTPMPNSLGSALWWSGWQARSSSRRTPWTRAAVLYEVIKACTFCC